MLYKSRKETTLMHLDISLQNTSSLNNHAFCTHPYTIPPIDTESSIPPRPSLSFLLTAVANRIAISSCSYSHSSDIPDIQHHVHFGQQVGRQSHSSSPSRHRHPHPHTALFLFHLIISSSMAGFTLTAIVDTTL